MKNRIKRFLKSRKDKIGLPPGTLKLIGDHPNEVTIEHIKYNKSNFSVQAINNISDIQLHSENQYTNWIKITGLRADIVEQIGKHFDLHNLILEDVLNTDQRPKTDDFKDYIYFVIKKHQFVEETLSSFQISFILTKDAVITFEELASDLFRPIKERIINDQGYLRSLKNDFLMYALIDVAIDNYFVIIERLDEKIEFAREMSLESFDNNKPLIALRILKDDLNYLRKYILPTKEAVYKLERLETDLIGENTDKFLRDLLDHINIISENLELHKDTVVGIREDYISNVNLKMNNVIQLLTIVSSVFIPLTFIAGVYGMNFKYMPELEMRNGYFIVLGIMAILAIVLLLYYKIKKWV